MATVKVYQLEDRSPGAPKQLGFSVVAPIPPGPLGTVILPMLHQFCAPTQSCVGNGGPTGKDSCAQIPKVPVVVPFPSTSR